MKLTTALMLSFVVFLWGSSFTVLKLGLEEVSPLTLGFLRFLIALPLLIGFTYVQGKHASGRRIIDNWKILAILSLTGVTLYHILQNFGLRLTTASNSSLIISSNPIFIALLGHIYLKERLTLKQILGITLAFLGVILIIRPLEWTLHPMGIIGNLLSLGAAISWAIYTVINRKNISHLNVNEATTYIILLGTLFFLPFIFTFENPTLPMSGWIWLLLLFLGLLCSGLGYLLWNKALEDVSAAKAGVFLFFIPVVSVSIAHLVLSEPLDILFVIGALFIMMGVIMTQYKRK